MSYYEINNNQKNTFKHYKKITRTKKFGTIKEGKLYLYQQWVKVSI
jgi:hypothetical protein